MEQRVVEVIFEGKERFATKKKKKEWNWTEGNEEWLSGFNLENKENRNE